MKLLCFHHRSAALFEVQIRYVDAIMVSECELESPLYGCRLLVETNKLLHQHKVLQRAYENDE